MRPMASIVADLRGFTFDRDAEQRLSELADEIAAQDNAFAAVPEILQLFERFPNEDFGSPGALVHVAEHFSGRGYEEELEKSLRRRPTPHTVWLANRSVNAKDGYSERFLALLRDIAAKTTGDDETVHRARDFLALHE